MNKTIVIGNLGRDVTMRYTPSGQQVSDFSLATNEKWTGQDGQLQERVTWYKVTCWGKQAEVVNEYLHKGSKVLVEGRLTPDPKTGGPKMWKGNDGEMHASYELTAQHVEFLSPRGEHGEAPAAQDGAEAPETEDIPF
jgi:single-strand DNA-binding protein